MSDIKMQTSVNGDASARFVITGSECTVGAEKRFTPVDGYGLDASWEKFIVMKNFEFSQGWSMLT